MRGGPVAPRRSEAKRILAAGAALLVGAWLAACGAAEIPAAGSPSPSAGGQLHVATDSDNGKTLDVRVGDRLELKLASTYWMVKGSSDPQVLRAEGPAVVSPQPSGCVAGGGCGTVDVVFDVVGAGSAEVTASRNSCGEAMGCTGSEGAYRVAVEATSQQ
jgi:hypothetical protein